MTTKNELIAALAKRDAAGKRQEKSQILDQFVSISGMHRKHAMRLLRDIRAGQQRLADIAHQGTPSTEAPDVESFCERDEQPTFSFVNEAAR